MCRKWEDCGQQYENPSHTLMMRGTRMKMNQKDLANTTYDSLLYRKQVEMTKGKGELFLHKGYKKLCLLDLLYREGYVQSEGLRNGR